MDRLSYYRERIELLEKEKALRDQRMSQMSWTRLGLFFIVVLFVVLSFSMTSGLAVVAIGFLVLFGLQVKKYSIALKESEIQDRVLQLNKDELVFMIGNKGVFPYGSAEEASGHIYASDLDIFGKGSLFQAMDRTATWEGRGLLIDTLLKLPKDIEEIDRRREAIRELENMVEWRQRFFALGKLSGETNTDMVNVRKWLQQSNVFKNHVALWLARAATVITFVMIAWMIWKQTFYPLYFFGWITVNNAIRGFFHKEIGEYFDSFGSRTVLFQKFSDLFAMVVRQPFTTSLSREHGDRIRDASMAFLTLSQLANRAEQRRNGLVGPVMNGLFLYDIWNVHAIEQWRLKYRDQVDTWIVALANIDMLASQANYRFNHPDFKDAQVVQGKPHLKATAMGHPLLPFDLSIKSDYSIGIETQAHIVTGSNMAGKSTFIRAVGLNLVLALNGLPVCADTFECAPMSIASCIRITDSLEENASYFRAELIRLEQIVSLIGRGEPYLVLLDEILRGTNSDDKRMGTLAFYKKLKNLDCLAILATHDLVIGKLEEEFPSHYTNFCFESELRGSELHFDYKLRRGVSRSTNATYLMKSLGLID